jgi:hypothetical protein
MFWGLFLDYFLRILGILNMVAYSSMVEKAFKFSSEIEILMLIP